MTEGRSPIPASIIPHQWESLIAENKVLRQLVRELGDEVERLREELKRVTHA